MRDRAGVNCCDTEGTETTTWILSRSARTRSNRSVTTRGESPRLLDGPRLPARFPHESASLRSALPSRERVASLRALVQSSVVGRATPRPTAGETSGLALSPALWPVSSGTAGPARLTRQTGPFQSHPAISRGLMQLPVDQSDQRWPTCDRRRGMKAAPARLTGGCDVSWNLVWLSRCGCCRGAVAVAVRLLSRSASS
jgi:hypothetical protein